LVRRKPIYAGVELGGTKCVVILARGPEEVIEREVILTTTPEATLEAIEVKLGQCQSAYGLAALGIVSFGPVELNDASPNFGHIMRTPKPGWSGTDVARRLQHAVGIPTGFDTDVNGAAIAELRWGSGRGFRDFAYITVGTGVGVGLVVNGRPTRGFTHSELGHIRTVKLPGDDFGGCCPFHGDCVEGLASGTAIEARKGTRSFEDLTDDDLLWDRVAWVLAQLCQVIVCTAAPYAIAIGGGVPSRQSHLIGRINAMLQQSLGGYLQLPDTNYVRPPSLGGNAGPLGAIAIAMDAVARG
jgi:fructokinase